MLVIPCSVKTLAGIANGYAGSLIERSADVFGRTTTNSRQETPTLIHIENMATVTRARAVVLPTFGFIMKILQLGAHRFCPGKALDLLGETEHDLFTRWKTEDIQGDKDA